MTCYRTRTLSIVIILFIFYGFYQKPFSHRLNPLPQKTAGGGNCFVRRSNKNYKTFIPEIIHDDDDECNDEDDDDDINEFVYRL